MVYADANCLLRFILNDNQEMADYTENLLNTQEVFLLHEVLCEMVYVLDGVYKTSRKDINKQLSALLEYVVIEDSDVMKNALQFYADTKLDFVDCILLSYFKTNNIQVATFDKKLKNKMKQVKPESQGISSLPRPLQKKGQKATKCGRRGRPSPKKIKKKNGTLVSNDTVTLLDINHSVPKDMYNEEIKGKTKYTLQDTFMDFHCGNTCSKKLAFCEMKYQKIMARALPIEVTNGTLKGDIAPGPITFYRLQSTADNILRIHCTG